MSIHKIHVLVAINFLGHKPCRYSTVVDHINNIRHDNRLINLQLVSHRKNTSKNRKGTSLLVGVSWDKNRNKWRSQIHIDKKTVGLGRFKTEQEARDAYIQAFNNIKKV